MRALTLGRVIDSRNDQFAVGELVLGTFGVTEHAVSDGAGVQKISPSEGISPSAYLGVLGMTGMTAYFGLLDVGRLQPGETVLVSGAAGAVGTAVGQKSLKPRVRASSGSPAVPRSANCLPMSSASTRRSTTSTAISKDQLRRHTPDRVDVFFDNIGGEILNQGLTRLARGARVVICGAVSQYNNVDVTGPSNYIQLLVSRASMTGFVVFDYADRYPQAIAEMAGWLSDGRLRSIEDTVRADIDAFPGTLERLFTGANTGKLVLELQK